jgi:cytidine deaminase
MKYQNVKLSKNEIQNLIKEAAEAAKNAFAPETEFGVGAAILTDNNEIYKGCNVQSVISGEGTCAERCAVHNAVVHGSYAYKAIAIVAPQSKEPIGPCGCCRQVIYEFAQINHKDIMIIMATPDGKKVELTSILEYLPGRRFGFEELGQADLSKYRK